MKNKIYQVRKETAGKFLKSMNSRYPQPAVVFCARELETGLGDFVRDEIAKGLVPTDEALKARAREILGVQSTAADDVQLLEKFKAMHGIASTGGAVGGAIGGPAASTEIMGSTNLSMAPTPEFQPPVFDESMLAEFEQELSNMDFSTTSAPLTDSLMADTEAQIGSLQEYTDLYRVSAATASPLRRKASEKMAEQNGFAFP